MPRRLSPQSLYASLPLNSMRVFYALERFPSTMQSSGFSMCSLARCSRPFPQSLVCWRYVVPARHSGDHAFIFASPQPPCFLSFVVVLHVSCSHLPSVSISGRTDLIEMKIEGVSFGYTPNEPLSCKSTDLKDPERSLKI